MSQATSRFALLGATVLSAAVLSSCGGGGGGDTAPATPLSTLGTLAVSMTDAPACGFDAVNVTVSKVRVHRSEAAAETDSGWTDITLNPAKKINLLNLTNGALEALGQTTLEAGRYSQLRLVLDANANGSANTVVPTAGKAEQPLDTPSGAQSGIKLVGSFDVSAGQKTDVVLDFDACKSVVTRGRGGYALKPVVKVVPAALNGISGFVSTALLGRSVQVTAQQNGQIVSATAPNPTTGEFVLSRLAPGNYDVVITAGDSAASVVAGVPVATTTSTTVLSTSAAPILLAPGNTGSIGGTVTMNPANTEAAYVSAKQSFVAGPTVTIRYQGADLLSGAYSIASLPVGAPQFAAYSSTLPLVFNASTAAPAGKYRVEAAAAGYVTKAVDGVDISVANRSNVNFALTR
ncbi:DUF4382 domain-containing protein [Massilia sp. IC2-476]|uniref:DUF4382 domain-containing protein n=1 Tax=Massilia sp. IC2-476 TaxID=2887199 RepID=UPI001D100BC9|nr:DUF4382 domain-containing protein [Massilia sp. IC2-476]MCC2971417.1 DUF4382 domain-containing protein [Massilia sp. IC2-476]